jgi:fatty acid desaturase
MLPRRSEDYRTLLWVLVLAPALVVVQYLRPAWGGWLLPLSCYFAISAGVIAHNHMHRPILHGKRANEAFSLLLSVLYGYPIFAWLPTHNLNHHKLVNRRGDATITWRYTNKHNVFVAASYFFVSAYFQSAWIKNYVREARRDKPEVFRRIVSQYVVTYGVHAAALAVAVNRYGAIAGLRVWAFALGIPAFSALWTIMLFNYVQHVHTDPWSAHNHSRNFEGRLLNFLLFGNGYHTIHHERASTHWADAAREHARIRPLIDDRLCHRSMFGFFLRQYLLAPFAPRLGTVQIGRAPFDDGQPLADFKAAPEAPSAAE